MSYLKLMTIVACLMTPAIGEAAVQSSARIVSVKKIWDRAPHCAFTDLRYWKGQFVCAFREGRSHVSADGKIRVLSSTNGVNWSPIALIAKDGFDLRDAGLSVAPDGRLMLNGGAAPRKKDNQIAPTGTFVAFSEDGATWTKPQMVAEPGRWMWRVRWRNGKAYGISYSSTRPKNGKPFTALEVSNEGVQFHDLTAKLLDDGEPTEAALRFADDGRLYCLQRRDAPSPQNTAYFGVSRPPYTMWQWHDLGMPVGGPNFINLPDGRWFACGRFTHGGKPATELAALDVEKNTIKPILTLPSGGDTSYPGLVWHGGMLWVSYYSSHEGKANIYLAEVRID
ncbi:MAG TPA: sialidase family protein [Lacipirellulaceae bacterium]|nr:sialidase family protein [Lacipirellulaceae bacterium]